MKNNHINKLILGAAIFAVGSLTSCEDYLTIYPTGSITKESYWNTSNDVHNVRAAAYYQLTQQVGKILTWGEFRSDNLQLIRTESTDYKRLTEARLQPKSNMFDWAGFYKGINYCNEVLENGQRMVDEEIDPSFTASDWAPIKAEMISLRALYYFYLVRAYRDVPYVTTCVSSDAEAKAARIGTTPGYKVLEYLINDVEAIKKGSAKNYGNATDNKGRWTTYSISALLADMYLWRAALVKDIDKKVDANGAPYAFEGNADDVVKECLRKSIEHCDFVLAKMREDQLKQIDLSTAEESEKQKLRDLPFPLVQNSIAGSMTGSVDAGYLAVFGNKNGSESVFELQFDGVNNKNSSVSNFLCSYANGVISPGVMGANPELFKDIEEPTPKKGFGRYDYRFPSTIYKNKDGQNTYAVIKHTARITYVPHAENVGLVSTNPPSCRTSANQDANWPVYRLADIMTIKTEAIARSLIVRDTPANDLEYAFTTLNALYRRNNPKADSSSTADVTRKVVRLQEGWAGSYGSNYDSNSGLGERKEDELLKLVYSDRQIEFLGEGKRWFDLVRECEWENKTSEVLSTWQGASKEVETRCRNIWALYNPIYYDEMKINGVGYGDGLGKLVQNPVWQQFMKD